MCLVMDKSLISSLLSECIRLEIDVDDVQFDQMMLIYDDFNVNYLDDYMRLFFLDVDVIEPKLKLRVREIDFGVPVVSDVLLSKKTYVLTEKRVRSLEKRRMISSQWRGLRVIEKDVWKQRAREWNALYNKKSTGYNRYLSAMYKELSSSPVSPEVNVVLTDADLCIVSDVGCGGRDHISEVREAIESVLLM